MFGLFKKKLPHCDTLFRKYLTPWYAEDDKPSMTRPDMYVIACFEGQPLDLDSMQYLPENILKDTKEQIQIMTNAALNDYQSIVKFEKLDLNVLDAVDKFFERKKISNIINISKPEDYSNLYLVSVCEFGSMLGYLFNQIDGFQWLYAYPYFHSIIVHRDTGFGITVFDWGVKKFSEYGVDDGFVAKFHAALDGINKHFVKDEK